MALYVYPSNVETEISGAYIGIPYPESISLDRSSISLTTIGQTVQLTATILPTVSDKTITWTSSDDTIATVSSSGLVTCVTPGECTITATTVNSLTATCTVAQGWSPTANTIAYFPLQSDGLDVMGNYTLSDTGTEQTLGRLFTSQSTLSSAPSSTDATALVWVYLNDKDAPTSSNYCQLLRCLVWNSCLFISGGGSRCPAFWIYTNSNYYGGSNLISVGQWYLIAITKSKSGSTTTLKGYVNGTEYQFYSRTAPSDVSDSPALIQANGTVNMVLSKYIIEDKARTAQEISDYYDLTKGDYGL